ncbi:MAG: hypothetical protein PHT44_02065 [Candidatus Portnoybacteria bacterium]|nr:hypothetical protein [Candidatus Portnoybacteria bacterium]MDD4982621.1 hypothetical protein [Candidatus Portnoybacteria bacterium]
MKNSFEGENLILEQQKLQHQREQYEKQAGKDAKKANTFLENISGMGLDKEDIIYMDAREEDKLREALSVSDDKKKNTWLKNYQKNKNQH